MKKTGYVVGLLGCSGLLARELVTVLEEQKCFCSRLLAFAEDDEQLVDLTINDEDVPTVSLRKGGFRQVDLLFFMGDQKLAKKWLPDALEAGCAVVDCSTGRNDDSEISVVAHGVTDAGFFAGTTQKIAAVPETAALQLALVLHPIHERFTIKRVVVSTYQPASQQGDSGIKELETQLRQLFNYQDVKSEIFPYQIAFNCLPQVGRIQENEYTSEETSLIRETRQLLGDTAVQVTATSCLVPTIFGNALAVNLETVQDIVPRDVRALLSETQGITVFDNPAEQMYPMPLVAAGQDTVFVGRIRRDASVAHGLDLWIAADNVRNKAVHAVLVGRAFLEGE